MLSKIIAYLPLRERIQYYNATIKPMMLYGSTVWTSCSKANIDRVFKLKKRATRTILCANYKDQSIDNWIPFYDEAEIMKCSIIYIRVNGNTPDYISDMFPRNHGWVDYKSFVVR